MAEGRQDAALVRWTVELARQVGDMLLEYFRRESLGSHLKADYSLCTEADLAADRVIEEAIRAVHPLDAIVSEENHTRYDSDREHVWIVDPIDGTTNFSHGMQHWGVSIARTSGGVPSLAVLLFPAMGELYVATRGGGLTLNGNPITVAPPGPEGRWGVMACCSRTLRHHHVNLPMKMRVFGCATYSLASVARGSSAVAFETRPKIWDLAAAWLLVEEAGGVVRCVGEPQPFPLQTGVSFEEQSYPLIAAATPELLELAIEGIQPR